MHTALAPSLSGQTTSLTQYLALFSRKLGNRSHPQHQLGVKPARKQAADRRAKVDNTRRMLRVTRT